MTPDVWRRVSRIYAGALARDPHERPAYVAAECGDDAVLLHEVESLLRHDVPSVPALAVAGAPLAAPSAGGATGTRMGQYRLDALIGMGGMGEVYRAHDDTLDRDVAIKILPPLFASDAGRRLRFDREARVLASLNHPNIGAIYGVVEGQGLRGLVLELVEGETLADRLHRAGTTGRRGLPLDEVLSVTRQLIEALDAAHERGIVHRDLKPANIKLSPDGVVKVLDFGLAKAIDANDATSMDEVVTGPPDRTGEGVILGTVLYMSPEQARGRPVDKRTDIWAFGCVVYEMVVGCPPFQGDTASDIVAAILEREPDWSAVPVATPPALRRLLRRCLEKNPKLRLRDIGDARADLESTSETVSVLTMRPRRGLLGVVAVTALAAGVAAGIWGRPADTSAPALFSRAIRLTNGQDLEFGPAVAPDGKWVAYFSNAGGRTGLWVKFLSGGEATNLTAKSSLEMPTRIDIGGIAIAPDGGSIAFDAGAAPGTPANLFDSWIIAAPGGGEPRKLVERGRGTRWSPDGTRIAFVRAGAAAGDALFVADADGTNQRQLVGVRGGMHVHWPAWSPDGRAVYYVYTPSGSNSEPAEIRRVSIDGGASELVVPSARRALFPAPLPDGSGLLYAANPFTSELGLWWMSLDGRRTQRPMTIAVGEYGELALARDGSSLVTTLASARQALMSVAIDVPAPSVEALTDGSTGDLDPTMASAGEGLVFSTSRGGSRSLWIAPAPGRPARPLTAGTSLDERPAMSPDGRQVAFVSDRRGERAIWVVQADGGAPRRLVAASVLDNLSWSPDSRNIVYATPVDQAPGLWIVEAQTGRVRRLATPGPATLPAWSPAGDLIAYVEARASAPGQPNSSRIAFVDSAGRSVEPGLQDGPNVLNGFLAWAPNGRQLAALVEPGASSGALWIVDVRGQRPSRKVIELPAGVRVRGATWSPDGRRVMFGEIRRSSDIVLFQR